MADEMKRPEEEYHAGHAGKENKGSFRDAARRNAIRGCLLGGAVGDALGAPVEFIGRKEILRQYGENGVQGYVEFPDGTGSITDDTQMTLFTAEGILRAHARKKEKGSCDFVAAVRSAYRRWLKTQGGRVPKTVSEEALDSGWLIHEKQLFAWRAPGNTCICSLEIPAELEKVPNDRKGCGTVMRMAPPGLFFAPEEAYEYGCRFSALTHGHPTGITAGGAFAIAPLPLLVALALWGIVFETSRYVSLASIVAAAALPLSALVLRLTADPVQAPWYLRVRTVTVIVFAVIGALAIFRHRSNIKRLIDGTESRFEKKK